MNLWKNRPKKWKIGLSLVVLNVLGGVLRLGDPNMVLRLKADFWGTLPDMFGYFLFGIAGAVLMYSVRGKYVAFKEKNEK